MYFIRGGFILFVCLLLTSCTNSEQQRITKAIDRELSPLQEMDEDLLSQYPSFEALFKEGTDSPALKKTGAEVISLYFAPFYYEIQSIQVSANTAKARVQITTYHAKELAKDFEMARMKEEILRQCDGLKEEKKSLSSLDAYTLLKELLSSHEYHTQTQEIDVHLTRSQKEWTLVRNAQLENALLGGLISSLSDPYLLSVRETLEAWLTVLGDMDLDQMCRYLGIDTFLNTQEDPQAKELGLAIAKQIDSSFSGKILSFEKAGYHATAEVAITSFDTGSVQEAFQKSLSEYLATPDALTDGEEGRYQKACSLLASAILENKETCTQNVTLSLQNDGTSWCIDGGLSLLGDALFGNLGQDLVGKQVQ